MRVLHNALTAFLCCAVFVFGFNYINQKNKPLEIEKVDVKFHNARNSRATVTVYVDGKMAQQEIEIAPMPSSFNTFDERAFENYKKHADEVIEKASNLLNAKDEIINLYKSKYGELK